MARWLLSPIAESELADIIDYVIADSGSVSIGQKLLADFRTAFEFLATSPNIGREREELTGPGTRWWRVHQYLINYDPIAQPIRILRIIHGARDLTRLLSESNTD